MAEKYRKIDPRIWKDENFLPLSERDKLIAIYVMTAQVNRIGLFNFSPALAAEDLGIKYETFVKRFRNVCLAFKWRYDERFRVLYIPTWWKYNQPENPNVLKGNLKDLHELPRTDLIYKFFNNLHHLKVDLHETLRERYPKPYPNQEQEQEQEQEQDNYSCSEPPKVVSEQEDGEKALVVFPLIKKDGEFLVFQKDIDGWQDTFPGVDILTEIKRCRQWNIDNPSRRKTKRGIRNHITGWLGRKQDKARGQPRQTKTARQNNIDQISDVRKAVEDATGFYPYKKITEENGHRDGDQDILALPQ